MATGANEHPCAVAPLVYIHVHELPVLYKFQEPLMRFAFISAVAEHHPRRLSNFAKTVLIT